jgi:hypothetical protein
MVHKKEGPPFFFFMAGNTQSVKTRNQMGEKLAASRCVVGICATGQCPAHPTRRGFELPTNARPLEDRRYLQEWRKRKCPKISSGFPVSMFCERRRKDDNNP